MIKKNKFKIILTVSLLLVFFISYNGVILINKLNTVKIDKSDLGITPQKEATTSSIENNLQPSMTKNNKSNTSVVNYVFFGIDSPEGETGRSDSIIIGSIDWANKELKLTSIPRDTYVNIDGNGKDKINHAYAFGGPQLAIKTINKNFNLDIDTFAAVNFTNVPKIVDKVNGLEIYLKEDEIPFINKLRDSNTKIPENKSGKYILNGDEILAYTRIRYTDGNDFRRTQRHRAVLQSLFKRVKSSNPTEYYSLLSSILPLIETNMNIKGMWNIGSSLLSSEDWTFEQRQYPAMENCTDLVKDGVYYLDFDRDVTLKEMHEFIFN